MKLVHMSIDVAHAFCKVLGSGWAAGSPGHPCLPHFSMPPPYPPFMSVPPHSLPRLTCCIACLPPRSFTTVHTHWLPHLSPPCCIPLPCTPVHQPFVAALAHSSMCVCVALVHVLGAPCEMAVGYDAGWWWVWVKGTEGMGVYAFASTRGWDLALCLSMVLTVKA